MIVDSQNFQNRLQFVDFNSNWGRSLREMIGCGGIDLDAVSSWKQMLEWDFQELGLRISLQEIDHWSGKWGRERGGRIF